MRALKFRAWANGYKKYCEYVEYTDGIWIGYVKAPKGLLSTTNVTIEQYTGLKDKNGKEIYEGDIVKWNDCIMKVVWENDCACFELVYPDNSIEDGMFVNDYMKNWIVVGNIYENKNLLGDEK